MGTIKVAIVEDDDKFRKDIVSLINSEHDLECKAEYGNAEDAIAFLKHQTPDIIIVDLDLKARLTGIDVIRELKKYFDETYLKSNAGALPPQFLVNTISDSRENVFKAVIAGAVGYVLKGDPRQNIIDCIRDLHAGGSPMSSTIARQIMESLAFANGGQLSIELTELTPTENKVLQYIAKGWSNKMIAGELHIQVGVVKVHCNHMYEKLHVKNRTEAAAVYLKKLQDPSYQKRRYKSQQD